VHDPEFEKDEKEEAEGKSVTAEEEHEVLGCVT